MGWIYLIINKINGKMYVGKTRTLCKRMTEHRNCKRDYHLYNAIRKYGWENFAFIEWKRVPKEMMGIEERKWVIFFDCLEENKKGYNNELPTEDGGFEHSEKTKQKMSISHKGKKQTEEHKQKISIAHKGLKKGKTFEEIMGEETAKRRKAEIQKQVTGINNPNYGRKHTKEEREQMSKAVQSRLSINPHPHLKFPLEDRTRIKEMFQTGKYTKAELGRIFGISWTHTARILKEK